MNQLAKAMADLETMRAGAALVVRESRGRDPIWGGAPGIASMVSGGDFHRARELYEGFHDWPFACISAIARRIAEQPVRVSRFKGRAVDPKRSKAATADDNWAPLDSHPFLDVMANPNELMTEWAIKYVTAVSIELTGRGLLWLTPENQLWPVPLHWCRVESDSDRVFAKWLVTPEGSAQTIEVDADRMMHFQLTNPLDPRKVYSPYMAACRAIAVDNSILDSQLVTFENAFRPSAIITLGDPANPTNAAARPLIDDAGHRQVIEALRGQYQGLMRRGEPFIVDAMVSDIKPWSLTPQEMDFQNSSPDVKKRILQIFAVHPIILGEIEGANRASAVVADQHFCANAVNPVLRMMSETLSGWAGPIYTKGGERLRIEIEPATPSDPEETRANLELLARYGGVTINQMRTRLGEPTEPGGDVAPKPFNLTYGAIGENDGLGADDSSDPSTIDEAYTSGDEP